MLLSIIIPTIGRGTLWQVLDALDKHYADFSGNLSLEVLVIFDGAGDLSKKIWGNFRHIDVQFWSTGKKVYAGGARNVGLRYAKGDLIAFLGDDTVIEYGWFDKIAVFFEEEDDFKELNISSEVIENKALLGYVGWGNEHENDPFYQFLLEGPQFNFKYLSKFSGKFLPEDMAWKFFYTSNIVLPKKILANMFFKKDFEGWGFEDIEFGYRLVSRQNLDIFYDKEFSVVHYDDQSFDGMIARTKMARKNATIFEHLHPEVQILPRGKRLFLLKLIIFFLIFFPKGHFPRIFWWREWKRAWIG